jgi:hypothetical protein
MPLFSLQENAAHMSSRFMPGDTRLLASRVSPASARLPVPAPIIKTNVPMKQTTAPGFTGRCELLFSSVFLLSRFSF